MAVIGGLYTFGNRELFAIDTENSELISMNALPLVFKYKEKNMETVGNLMLPLNVPTPIPGLTIDIVDLGPMVSKSSLSVSRIFLLEAKIKNHGHILKNLLDSHMKRQNDHWKQR